MNIEKYKKLIILNILYFLIFWITPTIIFIAIYDQDPIRHLVSSLLVFGKNFFSYSPDVSFVSFLFNDLILFFPYNIYFVSLFIPFFIMKKYFKISNESLFMWLIVDILIVLILLYFLVNYSFVYIFSNLNSLSF
jgi:hypothetical protein